MTNVKQMLGINIQLIQEANMNIKIKFVCNIIFILGLIACSSPTYMDAEDEIARTVDKTTDLLTPAHVVVTDEAFIDNKPVFHEYHPIWTEREVTVDLNNKKVNLKQLMSELFKPGGAVNVLYDEGVEDPAIEHITINGKLIEVIKQISKAVNYHYIIENNDLIWTPFETRIFQLGVLPGNADYKMGEQTTAAAGGFATIGGGAGGGNVSYSSATNNPWDNVKDTLEKLKSKDGSLILHKDASTVTVIDRPNNMSKIANYVTKFNLYHMQQVGIKVQVLEVELDEEHKRGIDWNLVRNTANTESSVRFNLSSPPNSTIGSATGGLFTWKLVSTGSNYVDSALTLLQFIEQQGNVAIVSEPRFTILNNQAAEIKITSDEGYAKSRKDTLTTGGTSQVSVEPGIIRTGFSLYIVPTIFDDEVLLQISTSLSRNLGVTSFSSAIATGAGATGSVETNLVQLPNLTDRKFTQRSVVPNNSTLVLTGFKEVETKTGDQTPFKLNILGGQAAEATTTEIVVLITPVIIRG